jgi:pilus assembly protein Flp/PilA
MAKIISFLKDESGASAAEYALILAIVGLGVVASARALGSAIGGSMHKAANCVSNSASCS